MDAPQAEGQTETGRLEAFSDGVFAVAITLLALNLSVPHLAGGRPVPNLAHELLAQWPTYLAYALSFITILIMWVNHHTLFTLIRRTDHQFLLLNGLLLLVVTTMPFGTALLADYIQQPERKIAQIVYSGLNFLLALTFNNMLLYATRNGRLLGPGADPHVVRRVTKQYRFGPPIYLLAVALSFVSAEVSLGLCILLAVFFSLPSSVTAVLSRR